MLSSQQIITTSGATKSNATRHPLTKMDLKDYAMTRNQINALREGDKVKMQLNPWTERTGTVIYRDGALRIAHDHTNQYTAPIGELDPKRISRTRYQ